MYKYNIHICIYIQLDVNKFYNYINIILYFVIIINYKNNINIL